MTTSKVLSKGQIKNLLNDNKNVNRNVVEPQRWPGDANMLKLAAAVERRANFVLFTNGTRFSIKYNDAKENLLIKPSTGGFVPMGYFSYKQLQEAVAADAINS